ncbi:MAG: hypothetical protein ACI4IR_06875 [Eubacterium sp.]
MNIKTNATDELKNAQELLQVFSLIEEKAESIRKQIGFFSTKDVAELTGISMPKVLEIFNRPDFPVCDYGQGKVVFIPAFCEYFMKAVKQSDFK